MIYKKNNSVNAVFNDFSIFLTLASRCIALCSCVLLCNYIPDFLFFKQDKNQARNYRSATHFGNPCFCYGSNKYKSEILNFKAPNYRR